MSATITFSMCRSGALSFITPQCARAGARRAPTAWRAQNGLLRAAAPQARAVQPGEQSAGARRQLGLGPVTPRERNGRALARRRRLRVVGSEYLSAPEGAQILQFGRLDRVM